MSAAAVLKFPKCRRSRIKHDFINVTFDSLEQPQEAIRHVLVCNFRQSPLGKPTIAPGIFQFMECEVLAVIISLGLVVCIVTSAFRVVLQSRDDAVRTTINRAPSVLRAKLLENTGATNIHYRSSCLQGRGRARLLAASACIMVMVGSERD